MDVPRHSTYKNKRIRDQRLDLRHCMKNVSHKEIRGWNWFYRMMMTTEFVETETGRSAGRNKSKLIET
jgi:hypothetical protein